MNKLYEAAIASYEAEKVEALAILDVYFNHAVGIGEHPDLLSEVKKYVEKLSNAEDCLLSLENIKRCNEPIFKEKRTI